MDLTQDDTNNNGAASNPQPTTQDDLAAALAGVQGMGLPQDDNTSQAASSNPAPSNDGMDFESFGEPEFSQNPQSQPQAQPQAPARPIPAPTISADQPAQSQAPEYATPSVSIAHDEADGRGDDSALGDNNSSNDNQPANNPSPTSDDNTIEAIKNSALKQLRPLMQHIELSPEEKFEKYLMMLRASDDSSLIEPAYKAAQQITSEKIKAQALLDVINEINYLAATQPA